RFASQGPSFWGVGGSAQRYRGGRQGRRRPICGPANGLLAAGLGSGSVGGLEARKVASSRRAGAATGRAAATLWEVAEACPAGPALQRQPRAVRPTSS